MINHLSWTHEPFKIIPKSYKIYKNHKLDLFFDYVIILIMTNLANLPTHFGDKNGRQNPIR